MRNTTTDSGTPPARPSRLQSLLDRLPAGAATLAGNYAAATGGSLGRLVFSLAYFVLLANSLSIAEFGIFATASATGVMLSRIVGFGMSSPLYRAATVKPRLIGLYAGGFVFAALISLPVLVAAGWLAWRLIFSGDVAVGPFALIIAAEALLWRSTEVVIIVNNGLGRFRQGALLTVLGTALRAVAALSLVLLTEPSLAVWAWFYLAANAASLLIALLFYWPRQRLRWHPGAWWRRVPDAISVCGAEILFYLQSELDKLVVLAVGGAQLAGLYAVVMRLIDLTAIPIRTFTMMLIQRLMGSAAAIASTMRKLMFEAAIALASTAGLAALGFVLWLRPTLLGDNVSEAAPLILLVLAVPAARNLVEYHAELLYGRGHSTRRMINLGIIGIAKAALLVNVLGRAGDTETVMLWLNGVFFALYLISLVLTYRALGQQGRVF